MDAEKCLSDHRVQLVHVKVRRQPVPGAGIADVGRQLYGDLRRRPHAQHDLDAVELARVLERSLAWLGVTPGGYRPPDAPVLRHTAVRSAVARTAVPIKGSGTLKRKTRSTAVR